MPTSSNIIPENLAQLLNSTFQNFQSRVGFKIRNAVRYKFDHKFEEFILTECTYCSHCTSLIYGLGQKCRLCRLTVHKKCLDSVISKCSQNGSHQQPSHRFKRNYFFRPTFCSHCGTIIASNLGGLIGPQGLKCEQECGMSVHFDCEMLVCHQCGDRRAVNIEDRAATGGSMSNEMEENWSRVSINDFDLIRILGTGSSGKVCLARLKLNQKEYAIKVIKKSNLAIVNDPESARTEMKVLNLGRQYNFLTIAHCCFQSSERLFYVMEHVVGRDLLYHIRKIRKFTEDQARFYSAEIVLALRFLHKNGIVYRDLKLENIFLDQSGHCKLLDFGLCKELCAADMKTRTFCGTSCYISPEMIKELDYGFSVDWWALGILMFEMLTGYSPFEGQNDDDIYRKILYEEINFPLKPLSYDANSALEGFLTKEPEYRLGCRVLQGLDQEILEHPFFMFNNEHRWEAIEAKQRTPPYRPSAEDLELLEDESGKLLALTPSDQSNEIPQANFGNFSFYSESFKPLLSEMCKT